MFLIQVVLQISFYTSFLQKIAKKYIYKKLSFFLITTTLLTVFEQGYFTVKSTYLIVKAFKYITHQMFV